MAKRTHRIVQAKDGTYGVGVKRDRPKQTAQVANRSRLSRSIPPAMRLVTLEGGVSGDWD